jgi:hypothetical protein
MAEFRIRPLCTWSRNIEDENATPVYKNLINKSKEKKGKKKKDKISKEQETMEAD